ncbi:MAG: FimV/HubP family polar landmark protein, partial [Pseudomonadota bacterium]|nr:FimV/HubP family polar landmark protein [Pseudomonadota bacterium]
MISFSKRALDWGRSASKYCGTQLIKIFTLVIFACLSNAAELGELRVYSTLGEPLQAEIDLVNMEGISKQELEVRLVQEEAAEQSGASGKSILSDIRFSVVSARDGSNLIRIASDQPLEDPVLDLNLELSWPFGTITKKYNALLKTSEQEPPSSTYGPVKEKDTLWSIAEKLRPNRSISVQQMMLAIQRKNANSFLENNINLLRAGTFLRIPSVREIGVQSREGALSEVRLQIDRYQKSWRAPIKAIIESEPPPNGESELKLRSVDKKENLADDSLMIDRLAVQEQKLLEAVGQLEIANESISELNSRIESLSSELDNLSEALMGKDKEIDALRRELRRMDKETIDLGKLLEITRTIHPILNDPYWALGTTFGLFVFIIVLFFLLRRSGSGNKDTSNLTFDESDPLSAESKFNQSVR